MHCLSGGGFRAVVFHLGALRRLNELGILGHIDVISSVSGGSIVPAHLATAVDPWPAPGERIGGFDALVADFLRGFTARNLRTWPIVSRALPWHWRCRAIENLAVAYRRRLTRKTLGELPERPRSSSAPYGVRGQLGLRLGILPALTPSRRDYMAGYLKDDVVAAPPRRKLTFPKVGRWRALLLPRRVARRSSTPCC